MIANDSANVRMQSLDCTDGSDNDGDGDIDCFDTDSANSPDCANVEIDCFNGSDDDGDGDIDCDDLCDCQNDPGCQGQAIEFNCADGQDDDGDGLIDCNDTDDRGHLPFASARVVNPTVLMVRTTMAMGH